MAEAHTKNHDYHLVDPSPWPFTGAVGAFVMAVGGIALMKWNLGEELVLFGADLTGWGVFAIGLSIILYTMFGLVAGHHPRGPSGLSYAGGAASHALRHDPVHRLGGDVLSGLVSGPISMRRSSPARRSSIRAPR